MNQSTQTEITTEATALIHMLLHVINTHIDQKVSAVLQAHSAVRYIDESFRDAIGEIAMEKVTEHDEVVHHLTDDSVREILDDGVMQEVRNQLRDQISNKIYDVINDYDFDEVIERYLKNHDFINSDVVVAMIDETVNKTLEQRMTSVLFMKEMVNKMIDEHIEKAVEKGVLDMMEKKMEEWNVRMVSYAPLISIHKPTADEWVRLATDAGNSTTKE